MRSTCQSPYMHGVLIDGLIKDSIQSWPFNAGTGNPAGASQNSQGAWVNLPRSGVWQALSTRAGDEVFDHERL